MVQFWGTPAQKITFINNTDSDIVFTCTYHSLTLASKCQASQDWAWSWSIGKPDVTVAFTTAAGTHSMLIEEGQTLTIKEDGTTLLENGCHTYRSDYDMIRVARTGNTI